MIAKDNLPLLIIENESFRQVMKTVTHLYTIPKEKYYKIIRCKIQNSKK